MFVSPHVDGSQSTDSEIEDMVLAGTQLDPAATVPCSKQQETQYQASQQATIGNTNVRIDYLTPSGICTLLSVLCVCVCVYVRIAGADQQSSDTVTDASALKPHPATPTQVVDKSSVLPQTGPVTSTQTSTVTTTATASDEESSDTDTPDIGYRCGCHHTRTHYPLLVYRD